MFLYINEDHLIHYVGNLKKYNFVLIKKKERKISQFFEYDKKLIYQQDIAIEQIKGLLQLVLPIIDTRHKTCFYSTIKKISTSKQLISNQKHLVAPSIYLLFYSSIDFDIKTDVHFNVEIIENVKGENTNILQTQAVFASLVRFEKFDKRRKQLLLL